LCCLFLIFAQPKCRKGLKNTMIKLKAKKRFMKGGTMIDSGKVFSVKTEQEAREYILRDLCTRVTSEERQPKPEADKEDKPEGYVDYGAMTVRELKYLAKERNISGSSRMTKAELIDALQDQDNQ
jgi:hypothetical protein